MLFSEYKRQALSILNKNISLKAFDIVVENLNYIREYHTEVTGLVSGGEYHLTQLKINIYNAEAEV